ncbi:MAG TPA: DUF1800 domain-containing protein [Kineosporiaceae bacterium]|nr:DUF1800 domain-containing protein [Kineosporiaceae bacterium]
MPGLSSEADRLAHLLRRTTWGLTPDLVARATKLGRAAWLEQQLRPASVADREGDAVVDRFPTLALTSAQVRSRYSDGSWDVMFDLGKAALGRAAWSRRQLLEVMVDVWSNHLNVTCPSDNVWDNRHRYDADVIRRHALGRFADLLKAAITHPAMLTYLDNASSTKKAPNENLGRELLELHTVGVGAGYTEAEVRDSARILTGLTVDDDGAALYRPRWHWTGPVTVLGFSHPNASADGSGVVTAYLDHLARHPATARRIATLLARRFVSDTPPAGLVDRLAKAYTAADTAVAPVLRLLLTSPEFLASADAKQRRPLESVVATVRALGFAQARRGDDELEGLYWALESMGHQPLAWPSPDGYPDVATAWTSSAATLARWNVTLGIAAGWWPKGFAQANLAALLPRPRPATHGALVAALGRRLLQRPLPAAQVTAICSFLEVGTRTPVRADSAVVGWRLPYVAALILSSPVHLAR